MSDGELARLVSEGGDPLTKQAAQALNEELRARGLNDDLLALEYPAALPGYSCFRMDLRVVQFASIKSSLAAIHPGAKRVLSLIRQATLVLSQHGAQTLVLADGVNRNCSY
jgi:hypothetical protein